MNFIKNSYQFLPLSFVCRKNTFSNVVLRSFMNGNQDSVRRSRYHVNFSKCSVIKYKGCRSFSIETFIDEKTYEKVADQTLDLLSEKLENIVEKLDPNTSDVVFNNGVITVSLGSKGTFVINKQTPNRQIWLSSPISGPKRYDYIGGKWIYKHDGNSLEDLLKTEFKELFQTDVDF